MRRHLQVNAIAIKTPLKSTKVAKKAAASQGAAKPTLLAGGNPQVPKGYGDAPVSATIAAMPGWKQGVGRRLDALIVRTLDIHEDDELDEAQLAAWVRQASLLPSERM